MAMLGAFRMHGGPHDGEAVDQAASGPPPETLYAITFDDGAVYARAGEQTRDKTGTPFELFRFDADGALTEHARQRFSPE